MNLKKDKLLGQKKVYVALLVILIFGVLLGLLFPKLLSNENQELLKTSISTFFNNVMNQNIDYTAGITNSLISNISYVVGVWILGISIIGLPIILGLLLYKGFIFGFSIASIIKVYGLKGIPSAIAYVFPGNVFALVVILLLSFYAMNFSIKLFRYLFLKENLNFKKIMNRYIKILGISLVAFTIISLYDVYLSPTILNLFTFLLK